MGLILGVDAGLTATKAVVFSDDGQVVGQSSTPAAEIVPRPGWVERDLELQWQGAAGAIAGALRNARLNGSSICAVAIAAHGDGAYLLDGGLRPLVGVTSLDRRATSIARSWERSGLAEQALATIGEVPTPGTPLPILSWLRQHRHSTFREARWVVAPKDWLRLRLTGRVATDVTDVSAALVDYRTLEPADALFDALGMPDLATKIPKIALSTELVGEVTPAAAQATGLVAGTPVAAGLHDIHAAALGSGGLLTSTASITLGTVGITEVIAAGPHADRRWQCRSWVVPGRWLHVCASPTAGINTEWAFQTLYTDLPSSLDRTEQFKVLESALGAHHEGDPMFLPFLAGDGRGFGVTGGAFIGLRTEHTRGDLLRAVTEGGIFAHREHVERLSDIALVADVRVSGGSTSSKRWVQRLADVLDRPVVVTENARIAGALGAGMCAAVGIGIHEDLDGASDAMVRSSLVVAPAENVRSVIRQRFARWTGLIQALDAAADGVVHAGAHPEPMS